MLLPRTLRSFAALALGTTALALGTTAQAQAQAQTPAPTTTIDTGTLRGSEQAGVQAFKGIPFAAAPVGPLRWRAPQPVAHWRGVRDATAYNHDCMQQPFPSDAAPLGTPPAEDCLYANVWRPTAGGRKLPVMVWIYGGGFVNGGASPATYSGANLARQGILVVSFNYRLGRFGTFVHPALSKADPDRGLLANYGYLDQITALRWVQRNVAAFGGDPANVTVVGESAGGMSVHNLLTSPMVKGLFQRAVIQSGGPMALGTPTVAAAGASGIAFGEAHGIAADDPGALAKLRALSAQDVTDGLNMTDLFKPAAGVKTFSSPVADARIAVDPVDAYRSGRFARVPVMVGATDDDVGGRSGPMVTGARRIADLLAKQGVPVYYYRFSYVAESIRAADTGGARHATDIPYFFDTQDIRYGSQTTPRDRAAGKLASGYLVNFVKTGRPGGSDAPAWPVYTGPGASMLDLTNDAEAVAAPDPWAKGL